MNYEKTKILDHGYIQTIDIWGTEERIIESARISTGKGFKGWGTPEEQGDEKLLAYLYKNKHMTPFEMCGMTIEIKAPIFVFREWHRHRTQSYNEMSARYIPLPNENYIPTRERIMMINNTNKQASSIMEIQEEKEINNWLSALKMLYSTCEEIYQIGLDIGIPKELARLCLPVGRYSIMRASANLRNWLQFLTLRMDEHAQWEIRQYAETVGTIIAVNFPRTWELFVGEI